MCLPADHSAPKILRALGRCAEGVCSTQPAPLDARPADPNERVEHVLFAAGDGYSAADVTALVTVDFTKAHSRFAWTHRCHASLR
jgi:hypothetical protein